jgi:hypothetical protein
MNHLIEYLLQFHKKHRVASHIMFWILVYGLGVFAGSPQTNPPLTPQQNIVWYGMIMLSKIPIGYWLVYVSFPQFFDKKQYLWAITLFFLAYYLNFCLVIIYKSWVYPLVRIYVVTGWEEYTITHFFADYFFLNLGVGASLVLIKLLLNRSEIEQNKLLLEKQRSEVELKLLKAQLNPHFLFNTLNNIYTLSLLKSPKTSESIARLSDILDYILCRCNVPFVPLGNEIKLIENYIALEKLRYNERLQVRFGTVIEKEVEIAPLILLTFVENAFKHGASEDSGSPIIEIDLRSNEQEISFKIANSINSNGGTPPLSSYGIGLQNLRQQLDLIYNNRYQLKTQIANQRFEVELTINGQK